jgi:hypothetical protein
VRINLQSDVNVFSFNSSSFPHNTLDCHLELVVPSASLGFSVFIEQMSLSGSLSGCREDYLQFSRDILFVTTHVSRKYCGIVELPLFQTVEGVTFLTFPDTPLSSRVYSEESDQDMDVWLHIENILGDRTVAKTLQMVVTPYQKTCGDHAGDFRRCPQSKICVKKDLFCDGMVNCPDHHGHPGDEVDCRYHHLDQDDPWPWSGWEIMITLVGLLISVGVCSIVALRRFMNTSKVSECSLQRRQLEEPLAEEFPPQIFPTFPPSQPPPYSAEHQPFVYEQPQLPSEPPRYELLWE